MQVAQILARRGDDFPHPGAQAGAVVEQIVAAIFDGGDGRVLVAVAVAIAQQNRALQAGEARLPVERVGSWGEWIALQDKGLAARSIDAVDHRDSAGAGANQRRRQPRAHRRHRQRGHIAGHAAWLHSQLARRPLVVVEANLVAGQHRRRDGLETGVRHAHRPRAREGRRLVVHQGAGDDLQALELRIGQRRVAENGAAGRFRLIPGEGAAHDGQRAGVVDGAALRGHRHGQAAVRFDRILVDRGVGGQCHPLQVQLAPIQDRPAGAVHAVAHGQILDVRRHIGGRNDGVAPRRKGVHREHPAGKFAALRGGQRLALFQQWVVARLQDRADIDGLRCIQPAHIHPGMAQGEIAVDDEVAGVDAWPNGDRVAGHGAIQGCGQIAEAQRGPVRAAVGADRERLRAKFCGADVALAPRRTVAVQGALLAALIRGNGAGIRPCQHGRAVRGDDRPRQRGAAVVAQRAQPGIAGGGRGQPIAPGARDQVVPAVGQAARTERARPANDGTRRADCGGAVILQRVAGSRQEGDVRQPTLTARSIVETAAAPARARRHADDSAVGDAQEAAVVDRAAVGGPAVVDGDAAEVELTPRRDIHAAAVDRTAIAQVEVAHLHLGAAGDGEDAADRRGAVRTRRRPARLDKTHMRAGRQLVEAWAADRNALGDRHAFRNDARDDDRIFRDSFGQRARHRAILAARREVDRVQRRAAHVVQFLAIFHGAGVTVNIAVLRETQGARPAALVDQVIHAKLLLAFQLGHYIQNEVVRHRHRQIVGRGVDAQIAQQQVAPRGRAAGGVADAAETARVGQMGAAADVVVVVARPGDHHGEEGKLLACHRLIVDAEAASLAFILVNGDKTSVDAACVVQTAAARAGVVVADGAVDDGYRPGVGIADAAAAAARAVLDYGALGQGERAGIVERAAVAGGAVVLEGAGGDTEHTQVVDAGPVARGRVIGQRAARQHQMAGIVDGAAGRRRIACKGDVGRLEAGGCAQIGRGAAVVGAVVGEAAVDKGDRSPVGVDGAAASGGGHVVAQRAVDGRQRTSFMMDAAAVGRAVAGEGDPRQGQCAVLPHAAAVIVGAIGADSGIDQHNVRPVDQAAAAAGRRVGQDAGLGEGDGGGAVDAAAVAGVGAVGIDRGFDQKEVG